MQIAHRETRTRTVRRFTVEDGIILPQAYSSAGRKFRLERVTLEYSLEGTFGDWRFESASLGGTTLKKDGSDSANQHDRHVARYDIREDAKWRWLTKAIDAFRPTGSPDFPVKSLGVETDELED